MSISFRGAKKYKKHNGFDKSADKINIIAGIIPKAIQPNNKYKLSKAYKGLNVIPLFEIL